MTDAFPQSFTEYKIQTMANAIRVLAMDAVEKAHSGHPGMPMGMADVATVLFSKFLKFDAHAPHWPDRDRFVLSAGHGSMLLYALLYLTGYEDMTIEEIKNFRQWGSRTAGHPEYGYAEGIETTTGPLGQGLGNAVGMALAEKMMRAQFEEDLVDHKIYTIVGDGCLMEGISHESISLAGHLCLNNLIVLFDDNHISIDGPTELAVSDDQLERFKASHWEVMAIDGHNFFEIEAALKRAQTATKPVFIACRTQIAKGSPHKAGTAAAHGSPLGAEEVQATRDNLSWAFEPFVIPEEILSAWRKVGTLGSKQRKSWEERLAKNPRKTEFKRRMRGDLPSKWQAPVQELLEKIVADKTSVASRQSSQMVLDVLSPELPELVGGSADLTGSNNTKANDMVDVRLGDYKGRYIHYGVREHGMAAAMNGIALHGGLIPYGGTFLTFSDYCRPAIRLSALMGIRVIYVMTHDSIGLGEDGPTHQPIEHLAALRAIPNLLVFRPADAVEVAECWMLALESEKSPSLLALTRQKLNLLRQDLSQNFCAKGAYVLKESKGKREITLLATGSEVEIAVKAQEILDTKGISTAVVSMPCWELFDQQDQAYQDEVLGKNTFRVAIEAASPMGWEKYIGERGAMIGMRNFGASAPAEKLFHEFGFTADHIVKIVEGRKT
ncbi:MAG: transketolase [Alphaproteobacteria bacterium 41-28]|nr:MAG: transketolase [Alphaproteobacteria bacterium 41-28]